MAVLETWQALLMTFSSGGRWLAALVGVIACALPGAAAAAPAAVRWPTFVEQLAADRVPPGSALEHLIHENQDFSQLAPEEAHDDLGLPAWLRVAWRRHHAVPRIPGDRSGGYPLVLQEAHEWLILHPDVRPVVLTPQLVSGSASALSENDEERSTGQQSGPRYESMVRIDPLHPNRIVGAANTGVGPEQMFFSADGGATWGQTSLALTDNDTDDADPGVDWTSDGTTWTTEIGIALPQFVLKLRAYRSADGGATWTFDSTLSASGTASDKDMLWADHSPTSPYRDHLYVIWHDGQTVLLNTHSPGNGWRATPLVLSVGPPGIGVGADVRTNANGDVFAFWPDTTGAIFAVKSTDGGASFSAPLRITGTYGAFQMSLPAISTRKALMYTSAGAWRTATRNEVYVAWMDLSGQAGCTTAGDAPGTNASSPCTSRIWFMRSPDGGTTWSSPARVHDTATVNDQFAPWLTIDESDGELGLIYYDTIGDPSRLSTNLFFQASRDGGLSWSAPQRVTSEPSNETTAGAKLQTQYGDYNGMDARQGKFLPSWTDRRSGGSEEIWSALVVDASAGLCLSTDLSLCLSGNRFEVTATWTEPDGQTGSAHAVPLTTDTGYLWFFSAQNVELVIKVLDGCAVDNAYWVFAGGLTNVHVVITVTDHLGGQSRSYTNPPNTAFQPIQDTTAFMSCP
jgi:hypothetical protein